MKFIVRRTSELYLGRTPKPCEGAKKEKREWTINLDTLDDLIKFVKTYGKVVVSPGDLFDNDKMPYEIEIYDTYRE